VARRPVLALGGVAGVVLLAAGTAVTHAAFTDAAEADLGPVGGAFDIALVDGSGAVVQGNPHPLVIAPAIEVDVVTTTRATGTITLTVRNARTAPLPTDPGFSGPGADPFDVARFTVSVDGEVVATDRAADLDPVVIDHWETGVARRVQVAVTLDPALGNPYYFNRAMVVGLRLDGSTA
jgi:predicted ribosomally synthesized peptide with SipW-like signal peptide